MGVRWYRSVNRLPIVWDCNYSPEFPESHRFPMKKFRLLKDWVDLHVPATQLFSPKPCPVDVLLETHDPGYVRGFQSGTLDPTVVREIGLPWSDGLRNRTIWVEPITRSSVDRLIAASAVTESRISSMVSEKKPIS